MNTAIVMLGSNVNQEQNLILAKEKLSEFFEILDESSILITKPVGKNTIQIFITRLLRFIGRHG